MGRAKFTMMILIVRLSLILLFLLSPRACLRAAGLVWQNDSTAVLFWTAPGDDHRLGRAAYYDMRFTPESVGTDTAGWWLRADIITPTPRPSLAGAADSLIISGLSPNITYYFALKTADEVWNWSPVSNIAVVYGLSCADVNGDGRLDLIDAVYMTDYFFNGGSAPVENTGDFDASGTVDFIDMVILSRYFYDGGQQPSCIH